MLMQSFFILIELFLDLYLAKLLNRKTVLFVYSMILLQKSRSVLVKLHIRSNRKRFKWFVRLKIPILIVTSLEIDIFRTHFYYADNIIIKMSQRNAHFYDSVFKQRLCYGKHAKVVKSITQTKSTMARSRSPKN